MTVQRTHAISVVGAKPPAVVTQAIHGQPVLRFSGDETPLVADGNNWSAEGFTAFVVASYAVIPEQPRFRDNLGYAVETPGQSLISDSGVAGLALGLNWNGRPGMSAGIIVADPSTAYEPPYPNEQASDLVIAAGKFYAFTYASREGKHNSKANAWDCWLTVSVSANGTASSILTTPFISMQAMNGGRRLQLGAAGDRDRFRGDLAEVILFNTELSEADRTTVLAYLRTKYGLRDDVSRLPADPVSITPTLDKQTFLVSGCGDGDHEHGDRGRRDSLLHQWSGAEPDLAPLRGPHQADRILGHHGANLCTRPRPQPCDDCHVRKTRAGPADHLQVDCGLEVLLGR